MIHTVFTPPVLPPKSDNGPSTTFAGHPEAVLARLMAQDAKAVRARHVRRFNNGEIPGQGEQVDRPRSKATSAATEAARTANLIRAEINTAAFIACLGKPKTIGDVMQETGMARATLHRVALRALDMGLVTRTMCKTVAIWELPGSREPEPKVKKPTYNETVAAKNNAAVMGALVDGMTTIDVADKVGLGRSAAWRRLETLERCGMVYRVAGEARSRAFWYRSNT